VSRVYWIPNLGQALGFKRTPECWSLLMSQWAWEGGNGGPNRNVSPSAKYNWLNSTTRVLGSSRFNAVGVQNYPTYLSGIYATAKTLRDPRYKGYLVALRSGTPLADAYAWGLRASLSTWVTGEAANAEGLAYAERVIAKAEHDLPLYLPPAV
jgi:hypothetical protein